MKTSLENAGYLYQQNVGRSRDGQSLLDYLVDAFRHSDRATWERRIRDREVTVSGAPASPELRLRNGQRVAWLRPGWREPLVPLGYAVLYRDEDLLAVAKPSGLPTLPGSGEFLEHTLLFQVQRRDPAAAPVHRLGRGTSGIVLCARTHEARVSLARAFRRCEVRKTYRGLVWGRPDPESGWWTMPIGRVPHVRLGTVYGACSGGKPSRTRFESLEARGEQTLLQLEPHTGRAHQLRIHTAAAGHPLAGDPLYASGGVPAPGCTAVPGDPGYWLHAERLEFRHPRTGCLVRMECRPPPPLRIAGERGMGTGSSG